MDSNNRNHVDIDRMKKTFNEFDSAEASGNIKLLQQASIKKANAAVQEILNDPYTPAKIKIALNIAKKVIENENLT